jgi:hypothetical protein
VGERRPKDKVILWVIFFKFTKGKLLAPKSKHEAFLGILNLLLLYFLVQIKIFITKKRNRNKSLLERTQPKGRESLPPNYIIMRYLVTPSNVEIISRRDGEMGAPLFIPTLKNFLVSFRATNLNEMKHLTPLISCSKIPSK